MPGRRHLLIDRVRWQLAVRIGVLCGITVGLIVDSPKLSFAVQPSPPQAAVADAKDSGADKDDSALNHSAVPLRNRDLQERLRRAGALIGRRESAAAITEIREATKGEPGSLILTSESSDFWQQYRDSHSVVEDLLRSLPEDEQALYLRQSEPLARRRFLKAVRDADVDDLRRLTLQFPLTRAAGDALQFLTAWHLDRREFLAADATARRRLRNPGLSQKQRDDAFRTIELCDLSSGEQRAAAHQVDAESGTGSSDSSGSPAVASLDRDSLELPLRAKLFPFLTRPDWQLNSDLGDETATLARHALHEHFEQSIPILPRARPLVVDGVVVRRSLIQVSAYDLESGRLLWADESESDAGQSASRLAMNLSLQELMAQKLARGLQVDSLQSRLSCDGERVFTVESGAGVMAGRVPNRAGLLSGSNYQNQIQNRIVARELRSGIVTWNVTADAILDASTTDKEATPGVTGSRPGDASRPRIRSSVAVGDRQDILSSANAFFCGLPTSVDRHVIGLVQVGELLRLYAADRNSGRVDWVLDIAEAARQSPSDTDWRAIDCRVTLVDGVLVCPTGAGLLVGVDLATRSVIWSRRYSRADMPLEVTRLPFAAARPQRPWWRGWRDITLLPIAKHVSAKTGNEAARPETQLATTIAESTPGESSLIVASPDADGLCSIDPRTGQLVWQQRVEAPVEVIADERRIVVVSRHSVSAFNVDSGMVVWRVPCREPVGTGYRITVAAGGDDQKPSKFYVFPVRGGSLVAVNLDDGTMLENVDRLESLSGCLVAAGDHVISMNPDRLSVWSFLSALPGRRRATTEPAPSDVDAAALRAGIEQAAFERSSGLFERAAARLREIPDSALAKRDLRKTLLAWLQTGTLSAKQLSAVEHELEQLVGENSIADLISIRHAAARVAAVSGDPLAAIDFYAKLQSLNPSGEPRFLKPEPLRSVRHDRLIQGEVIDLFNDCEEPVAKSLREVFAELARTAAASRDPFALQRFTRQWHDLPITAQHILDDRSRIGLRYGQKQLALLALADSDDRRISAAALRKLIELFQSRSYARDASAVQQDQLRWREIKPGTSVEAGFGISPWNAGLVTVSEHAEQNLDTTFIPVPVECQPGSLFDRLNVAINPRSSRDDTVLRFYGDGISGSWQTVLATSSSPLKSVGRMYRGWGIGHFLVLQLGAELFGVSPFDGSGEPRVQRLWSVDMAGGSRQEDHQYASAIPGFVDEELTMLDVFGRPIAQVGPVRAGYFCYQTRGKLVCLETSTGQRLWQRYELPRQADCIGDGENIFLIQPRIGVVTVLRVVDGATVSTFQLSDTLGFRGTILRVSSDRILAAERSADSARHPDLLRVSKIATLNLQSATVEWSSDVDPESTVFAIGPHWIGILQASGEFRIVDFRSGREVETFRVRRPDRIRAIHVSSDASSHVIALSETAESQFLNGRSALGVARNPSVTGQLVAIDSVSAALKWQRPVDRIRFLLDQPKNAPCLVLDYRRSQSSDIPATESVLHVINRETGEDILNRRNSSSASAFTFEPHADQQRLSIRMARKSIRLTFAPSQAP